MPMARPRLKVKSSIFSTDFISAGSVSACSLTSMVSLLVVFIHIDSLKYVTFYQLTDVHDVCEEYA